VVRKIGDVDYSVEIEPGNVKTYHIKMLKRYYHRNEQMTDTQKPVSDGRSLCQHTDETGSEQNNTNLCHISQQQLPDTSRELEVEDVVTQAAAIACVLEDNDHEEDKDATIKDAELLPLYNIQQKEAVDDVDINPDLSKQQTAERKQLLTEYRQIFSDVPTVTHLVEHKVELTRTEPVRCKVYPTPYKMQAVIDKEIEDMLAMGVIERSEAAYASPLVLEESRWFIQGVHKS